MVPGDSPVFYTPDGKEWTLSEEPIWKSEFGRGLCIVDVDTRPADGLHQAWSQDKSGYQPLDETSAGRLNHYLYGKRLPLLSNRIFELMSSSPIAVIHGYDYRYVHTQKQEGKRESWTRIPALSALLSQNLYDFIVYVDADVIFPHLQLPLEWLMNRWNITRDISISMALDLDWDSLKDTRGRQTANDGFQILSNSIKTLEILDEWDRCLDGVRYVGCERFMRDWPAEQGAFAEFLRYDYKDAVKELPCNEAMLWPGTEYGCEGVFVRHYTMDKAKTKEVLGLAVLDGVMAGVKEDMVSKRAQLYVEES